MPLTWLRFGFSALLVVVFVGCGASAPEPSYAHFALADPRSRPYEIGVADVVRVTVWKDPSVSTEMAVRPDGFITLPLIGDVTAAGRTTEQVKLEVQQRLGAFLKDAVVTVAVVEINSYRFTVAGNVERPSMFSPRYYVTVSEAIALAGGPNRFATPSDAVVIRPRQNRPPARIPIDYEKILSGARPDQDIVVLAGDTVLVP
jgi:polysaccharide export outer membrane protein